MGKTQENLKASEEFIRTVLAKHFDQKVEPEQLKAAAKKLCDAVPGKQREAA